MVDTPATDRVGFEIRKVYLKDVSFESPQSPGVFTQQSTPPQVDVQLRVTHATLDPATGFHEAVLGVTVTARNDGRVLFLVEVQQAGVFQITGVPADELERVLEVACPTVLLPFARETVADLSLKGGFPQLLVSTVNFDALFQQKRQKNAGAAQPVAPAAGTA